MDFSRPDNARLINRLKVLNALRKEELSRAELSRELLINKVSISEIVEDLMEDDLIKFGDMDKFTLGRPSIKLQIEKKKGRVFSLYYAQSTVTISASNLTGQVLRFERFPKDGNENEMISSFISKMTKDEPTLYGTTIISSNKDEVNESVIPHPILYKSRIEAEKRAEEERDPTLSNTYFVSWSDKIEAFYNNKYIPSFGSVIVDGKSSLDDKASGKILKEITGLSKYRDLTEKESALNAIYDVTPFFVFALKEAIECTGADKIMLLSELSAIPDDLYLVLRDQLRMLLGDKEIKILKPKKGDSAFLEGGALIALDEFFYHSTKLKKITELQNE